MVDGKKKEKKNITPHTVEYVKSDIQEDTINNQNFISKVWCTSYEFSIWLWSDQSNQAYTEISYKLDDLFGMPISFDGYWTNNLNVRLY